MVVLGGGAVHLHFHFRGVGLLTPCLNTFHPRTVSTAVERRGNNSKYFSPESRGHNLALAGLFVPCSLDIGLEPQYASTLRGGCGLVPDVSFDFPHWRVVVVFANQ